MGKTFKDRLDRLKDIEDTLKADRKFYMSHKNWDKVAVISAALKQQKEQVARVLHMSAKDTFRSA